ARYCREMILLCKLNGFVVCNRFSQIGLLFFFCSFPGNFKVNITVSQTDVLFFCTDTEAVCTHSREAFGELLVHGFNGGDDAYQRHDSEGNDGYSEARSQFVAANRSKGK